MNNLGDTGAIQDDNLDNMFKAEIEQFVKTVKAL
jgi:hypothetical protein